MIERRMLGFRSFGHDLEWPDPDPPFKLEPA